MSLIEEYGQNKENLGIKKGMKKGMKKGIEKGMEKGKEEERENIIKNLLESGMDAETISKTAKIPLPKVKEIKRKIKY